MIGRLKGAFADVPKSRILSEELIRERREEAAREAREYEDQEPLDVEAVRRRLGLLRGDDDEGRW